jgi:hypothetical protein
MSGLLRKVSYLLKRIIMPKETALVPTTGGLSMCPREIEGTALQTMQGQEIELGLMLMLLLLSLLIWMFQLAISQWTFSSEKEPPISVSQDSIKALCGAGIYSDSNDSSAEEDDQQVTPELPQPEGAKSIGASAS